MDPEATEVKSVPADLTVGGNRLNKNPNTGMEDTDSKQCTDSTRNEEPQGKNVIVDTRCDITRNPEEKSNYLVQVALALAVISVAVNVGLFQSNRAIMKDLTVTQNQMESLRREILTRFGNPVFFVNEIHIENSITLEKKQTSAEDRLQTQSTETKAIKAANKKNEGLMDGFRNELTTLNSSVEQKWKTLSTEYKPKPSLLYSPYQENEAKLNDLRRIRDLIINHSNPDLKAKLSKWLLQLQNAENMFEIDGSLKSMESQERILSKLLDEEQLFSFAEMLFGKAKYTQALGLLEPIIKRRIVTLGPDHFDTLSAQYKGARCLVSLKEFSKALHIFRFVHQKWSQTLGPEHQNTLLAQHYVALMLHNEGKYADALTVYEQVLQKEIRTLGEKHVSTKLTKSNIENTRQKLQMTLSHY